MSDYRTKLCEHLAIYKRNVLGVVEDGTWARNRHPYPHILPAAQADLNLVPSIRDACGNHPEVSKIKRHRDFHHLNSSQALAINLFFPLLVDSEAQATLLEALGVSAPSIAKWVFEAVEDPREATNFDVLLDLQDGHRVYIEVKLTESDFGTVSRSPNQLRRREELYLPRLNGKVDPAILEESRFFKTYQLLRNASYASKEDRIVLFLVPNSNTAVAETVRRFTSQVVTPEYRPYSRAVYLEDVIGRLLQANLSTLAKRAITEVAEKYTPNQPAG